jgi:hypothetical protein
VDGNRVKKFYLGAHHPHWLGCDKSGEPYVDFALCVANQRLAERKTLPRAMVDWMLDSGGFSILRHLGEWPFEPEDYVRLVRRYMQEIGRLDWAAPMDWVCAPQVREGGTFAGMQFKGTGKTVTEHHRLTVDNYVALRMLDAELPFRPIVQGWTADEFLRHVDMYDKAGVDLFNGQTVGVGSIAARQGTGEAEEIVSQLAGLGLRLHGYGVKTKGLMRYAPDLDTADSMSWSARGRRVDGCTPSHKTENNCLWFARKWRRETLDKIPDYHQMRLFS